MMELFLSSDGKHTVHVTGRGASDLFAALPQAKLLYEKVVDAYGAKAANGASDAEEGEESGAVETVADETADHGEAPLCPVHKTPMAYREGRYGAFWSCPTRTADGGWCPCTIDVSGQPSTGNGAA